MRRAVLDAGEGSQVECPKCDFVYSPLVSECRKCNVEPHTKAATGMVLTNWCIHDFEQRTNGNFCRKCGVQGG